MKTTVAIFALCFVASHAAVESLTEEQAVLQTQNVLTQLKDLNSEVSNSFAKQIDRVFVEPMLRIDEAVQNIHYQLEESHTCFVDKQKAVQDTIDVSLNDMTACGETASRDATQIAIDVSKATQQLIFDGLDVLETHRRCKKMRNALLKASCRTKFTIKSTLYLKNAPRSVKTIRSSIKVRLPAVIKQADVCTHTVSNNALEEFNRIQASIDTCIPL